MKFSTIAIPALMGLTSAQDVAFEDKRKAGSISPLDLLDTGSLALPAIQKRFGKRNIGSLDANDLKILQTLEARDADPISPGALTFLGSAAGPVANWLIQKVAGAPKKRDLTAADIDELNSIFMRDGTIEERDAFDASLNVQRISPSSEKHSIAGSAPVVRRNNLNFIPVQFSA